VRAQHAGGARIVGMCGGYQMLGESIEDPEAVESRAGCAEGLGLLPVRTVLRSEKTTRVVDARTDGGVSFRAYEIHMGETVGACEPFAWIDGDAEGARMGSCVGTYLHGALENPQVVAEVLGTPAPEPLDKEQQYDRLAEWFESHADLRLFEELYL